MKRFVLVSLVCALLLSIVPVVFAAGNVSFTGPEQVRAGDTITLTFCAGGDNIYGGQGTVSYDASQLTLNGYTAASLGGSWKVEITGDKFVFYDDTVSKPLGGSTAIFTASFTVKALEPGTTISVSVNGVKLSDEAFQDTNFDSTTYTATILPPLSDNCTLASMTVSNAAISPAFSPDVTSYSASVPFATSSLQVEAAAAHPGATVSVKNTALTAGATTTVSVTVTAENGAKKEYSIQIKREQDPNYVPSSNALLRELTAEGYALSPAFSPEVTQYYVWLPYEAETLALSAFAEDSKASVKIDEPVLLTAGQRNDIAVTVTAEDSTQKIYTVTAVRAPAHDQTEDYLAGNLAIPTEPETQPETEPETEPATTETTAPPQSQPEPFSEGPFIIILAGACAACLLLGLLVGVLIARRRPVYLPPEEE